MKFLRLHLFFFIGAFFVAVNFLSGALSTGEIYSIALSDLDGRTSHTNDGNVTVVVLVARNSLQKAETVGDRVPGYCLGNPSYRMITVVQFRNHSAAMRAFLTTIARRRMDSEARHLQTRYDEKKIDRNARLDLFVVADFDGKTVAQLGGPVAASGCRTLVFGRDGRLLAEWNEVPTVAELAAVVK